MCHVFLSYYFKPELASLIKTLSNWNFILTQRFSVGHNLILEVGTE